MAGNHPEMECPFARMHREYRQQCIENGTYRPFSDAELESAVAKWKFKRDLPPRQKSRRRTNPKGTAD